MLNDLGNLYYLRVHNEAAVGMKSTWKVHNPCTAYRNKHDQRYYN